jgi:hypothetical protein
VGNNNIFLDRPSLQKFDKSKKKLTVTEKKYGRKFACKGKLNEIRSCRMILNMKCVNTGSPLLRISQCLQKNVFFVFFSLFIHKKTVAM